MRNRALAALAVLALTCAIGVSAPPVSGQTPASGAPGLLFSVSADHGLNADVAAGGAAPVFADLVSVKPGGPEVQNANGAGHYIEAATDQVLAWSAPGNIYAQRGTLSFYWRARDPIGETEFPIFRVGYANHTSWDMVFLRIDWNGHGFDAFVTDSGLARERVSYRLPAPLDPQHWVHLAFAWDENTGVRLYVDGQLAGQVNQPPISTRGFRFSARTAASSRLSGSGAYTSAAAAISTKSRLRPHARCAQVAALAHNQAPTIAPSAPLDLPQGAQRRMALALWLDGAPPPVLAMRKRRFAVSNSLMRATIRSSCGKAATAFAKPHGPGFTIVRISPAGTIISRSGLERLFLGRPRRHLHAAERSVEQARVSRSGRRTAQLTFPLAPTRAIGARPANILRTTTALPEMHGGKMRFDNNVQEIPLQEVGAYNVTAGAAPEGVAQFILYRALQRIAGLSRTCRTQQLHRRPLHGRRACDGRRCANWCAHTSAHSAEHAERAAKFTAPARADPV